MLKKWQGYLATLESNRGKAQATLQWLDLHTIQFEPLSTTCYGAEAQYAAWCGKSILVIEPCHETQGASWRLRCAKNQCIVDPEKGFVTMPFQGIAMPFSHIHL